MAIESDKIPGLYLMENIFTEEEHDIKTYQMN